MKEFQAFKDTLSNKTLKDIYEESKLEVQNETTEGTEDLPQLPWQPKWLSIYLKAMKNG